MKLNWLTALSLSFRSCGYFGSLAPSGSSIGTNVPRRAAVSHFDLDQPGNEIARRELRPSGLWLSSALSIIVCFAGAAGMLAFESDVPNDFKTYGDALWWTAMLLKSISSDYFPQSAEGQVLCFIIALYGFAFLVT